MRSSKAVLLNMFQADRDVLHHLTFEDNHRVSGWPVVFFFFSPVSSNRELSASLMMDVQRLVMCKEGDNRSQEVAATQAC